MATARAISSGNWSATSTWNGGVLPGNGDTVYSNGFTVTIDQNVNIGGTNNPIVNAGSFVSGQWYKINSVGSTSFTGIGAATNATGTIFLASGAGSGTGTAIALATLTTASNTAAGATAGAGGFSLNAAYNVNADIRAGDNRSTCLTISATSGTVNMTGQVIATPAASNNMHGIVNSSNATVILNGYSVFGIPQNGWTSYAILNSAAGIIRLNSCIIGNLGRGITILNNGAGEIVINGGTVSAVDSTAVIQNAASGSITVSNATLTGGSSGTNGFAINNAAWGLISITGSTITASAFASAVNNAAAGSIICVNCTFTSVNGINAVNSTNASATNRFSGTFISSSNGTQPINASRWILNSSPTVSYIQHALDGINSNSFVRFFTADNSTALNQASPTDVRNGVIYGIGNSQTGRLTVPARGSVALSVNYGPSMPFTATRSGTTATANLAYSYPLVVGDEFTVTGASNTEWNSSYTIASVVSGTSVTFTVPNTHSSTAGTGATMQTTGTAVLDPAAVASAVWGAASRTLTSASGPTAAENATAVWAAASRTITGGTVDTLTNAPTVPSASAIASAVWAAADKTGYSLTSAERTAIATAVETSILNEADGQQILNAIVGAIGNQNVDQVALVAAIRSDLERAGGRLINLDATVSSRLAPNGTLATVTTLTNAPTVPTPSQIASQVRTELSTELARVDQAISSRLAGSAYTAPANSDIAGIKAKTDNLPASPAAVSDIPTSAQNASATRSELSLELARVDAAISTRATPANIPTADISAIKAKTDSLNVDRVNNTATLSQVGNLLAQANS